MTTEPTIEQMNEVIALFMGLTPIPAGTKRLGDIKHPEISTVFLKYHSSWDWLMPVVKKLKSLYLDFDSGQMRDQLKVRYKAIENELGNLNLSNTHYCAFRFIQWYNKNTDNANNTGNHANVQIGSKDKMNDSAMYVQWQYTFDDYEVGATEWTEKAQGLVDALEMARREIVALYKTKGYSESFVTRTIDEAIAKYKEVTNGE